MWDNMPALKSELDLFEQALIGQFDAKHNMSAYLDKLSLDIIQSGGKRLRPAMMIASAMLGEYDREKVLNAAVSMELLHTATLVHDDIIDNALLRRNSPTVFATHGASAAVFTGDYIFVKSILALALSDLPASYMQQLAKAVQAVCVGEVREYQDRGRIPTFKDYISRVFRKTGVLFASSCALGAHSGKLAEEQVKAAARFGGYFGIAFQILDDLSDIDQNQKSIGKPVGNDLKEGIVTLPVLFAVAGDENARKTVESFLKVFHKKRSHGTAKKIAGFVAKSDSAGETKAVLKRYLGKAKKMLEKLPDSEGRTMLYEMMQAVFAAYFN
ncbi:MAG: polyprenyl synthetase family protein [Christensenellales bacterium]